jgi:hypothetical protein
MKLRILFGISLLSGLSVWSQVNSTPTPGTDEAVNTNTDDARMLTPPPVSGQAYPTSPESQERSNYLRAGVTFNPAYSDNTLGGLSSKPVSDVNYSVWPTIELDQTTPRLKSILTYAPGFTFYQRTTGRDEADQNATMDVEYRVTEHVTASVRDSFQKTSNVFNQPDLVSSGAVYGSSQPPTTAVLPPIADQLRNSANAELTYQFSANGMVGGSGTFTNLHYPNQAEVPGLYDSSSRGGSAFYSHRVSKNQYLGAQYQYSRILAFPTGGQSQTETHTLFLFYTVYLKPTLSLSLSGGPQLYEATQPQLPASSSWAPAATASLSWQGRRATFAAGYARTITSGGGLTGAFHSNNATVSAGWQIDRSWSIGVAGNYAIYRNAAPFLLNADPGGHTIFGTASLHHPIGQYFAAEAGYTRIHQSYSDVAVVSGTPDTNREYIAISYRFNRPLGR